MTPLPSAASWLVWAGLVGGVAAVVWLVDLWQTWMDTRQWEEARRWEDQQRALERIAAEEES